MVWDPLLQRPSTPLPPTPDHAKVYWPPPAPAPPSPPSPPSPVLLALLMTLGFVSLAVLLLYRSEVFGVVTVVGAISVFALAWSMLR